MPSATVGSPRASCQWATGSWLVTMVERSWTRSSITSSRSAAWSGVSGRMRKSSIEQDVDAGPVGEEPGESSFGAGDGDLVEQSGCPQVDRGVAAADGGVGEGAGEVGLAEPGGADDGHAVVGVDPVRLGEGEDLGAFEAALSAEVDVFDGGRAAQLGRLQDSFQFAVAAFGELAVDEHGEAFLEAERGVVGVLALFEETSHHAGEPEGVQPVDGGVGEHVGSFHW